MKQRIVVLGMMGAYPFGGQTWLYINWLTSLRALGHEVWYVEDNCVWQYDPDYDGFTDACRYGVEHVSRTLDQIGFGDRWIYRWAMPPEGCWGATLEQLRELYRSCDLLLNVCVATELRDDHLLAPYRVWVETDPVLAELRVAGGDERVRRQFELHQAFATYGENYGAADCRVPLHGIDFIKIRQPIDLELWPFSYDAAAPNFTTVGNFRTDGYDLPFDGDVYHWSKHHEWERFADLPSLTAQPFQLALKANEEDTAGMKAKGWDVVPPIPMSLDVFGGYRQFIQGSRGQFTVAKDQNVRLRSGWFSERDACYLASGKPVVAQDTAFQLPRGNGLFGVSTPAEAAAAIDEINADYQRQCRAARQLAEDYFNGPDVVAELLNWL